MREKPKDLEILATYLRRRFKGRVETFDVDYRHDNFSNLRLYFNKNVTVEFWVYDGEVKASHYRVNSNPMKFDMVKLHLADPDFEVKLYVFLTDMAGLKPSKLKAEY